MTFTLTDFQEQKYYPIGKYKNEENAKAAFKRLVENISKEIPLVTVRTDEEIEKSIHQEDGNSN